MFQYKTQCDFPINIPASFHCYNVVQFLGFGSTCVVVLIEEQKTHELYSAKIMAKKDIENKMLTNSTFNEVKILQSIDHPNIIKMIDFLELTNQFGEEYYVLITEYCENGNLLTYATNNGFKSESEKKKIIQGFLKAISYLHNHGISHGDIKSENVLLDSSLSPKLCDFGFSKKAILAGEELKNGTLFYAAPELFIKGQFDTLKADIYAIGITLYSLSELQFPFKDGDQNYIVSQIVNGNLSFRSEMDQILLKLVEKCTTLNPQHRPSIEYILKDEYFTIEEKYICKINNFSAKDFMNSFKNMQALDF